MSQLQSSLLLGALSLIPNDTLRYTAIGLAAGAGIGYAVHLKRPSIQLNRLEIFIKGTEEIILAAKGSCLRDVLSLAEESIKLLEVKRSASVIQCRILDVNRLTWKQYRILCRDIIQAVERVKRVRTTVQLIVEAERQRKFTEDIATTQTVLARTTSPSVAGYSVSLGISSPV
ncbi:hypothetical protein R3P38DRAFT_2871180 [Favolaschia claudopus]|uniref:ATP synthase protein MI25 n=1 Tax=Favolaschia claudopus TaxID=2862362 RepID=A0AAW0DC73_9AGAR